jgi:hypothetical protein
MSYLEPRDPVEHDPRCASLCDDVNCEHDDHECTCAEIAAHRAEREAEAWDDYREIAAAWKSNHQ